MDRIRSYKYCVVPRCESSTVKTASKMFFHVPFDKKVRQQWSRLCKRQSPLSEKSKSYICEDHFTIPDDVENYHYYKLFGGPLKLKKDIAPRYFDCQKDTRTAVAQKRIRPSSLSVESKKLAREILKDVTEPSNIKGNQSSTDLTFTSDLTEHEMEDSEILTDVSNTLNATSSIISDDTEVTEEQTGNHRHSTPLLNCTQGHPGKGNQILTANGEGSAPNELTHETTKENTRKDTAPVKVSEATTSHASLNENAHISIQNSKIGSKIYILKPPKKPSVSVFTQTNVKLTKYLTNKLTIQTVYNYSVHTEIVDHISEAAHCNVVNINVYYTEKSDSNEVYDIESQCDVDESDFSDCSDETSSQYEPDSDYIDEEFSGSDYDDEFQEELIEAEHKEMQALSLRRIRYLCKKYPMLYLGVAPESYYIIDMLSEEINYASGKKIDSTDIVNIILMKVRLNHSYAFLGNEFGLSIGHISFIINKYTLLVSEKIDQLIVTPEKELIYRTLPLTFYARYSHVQYVIDCFEIESQKPTNAVSQSMTWSEYKKANTFKYLLSMTAGGLINFVSDGFGGRISDVEIVKESGYITTLNAGDCIMADRGFKFIEELLRTIQVSLIRPPSVKEGEILPKHLTLEAKRIASLRGHVERCIRRVREYKTLAPHACVEITAVHLLDHFVKIGCGLVNLQGALIKI